MSFAIINVKRPSQHAMVSLSGTLLHYNFIHILKFQLNLQSFIQDLLWGRYNNNNCSWNAAKEKKEIGEKWSVYDNAIQPSVVFYSVH